MLHTSLKLAVTSVLAGATAMPAPSMYRPRLTRQPVSLDAVLNERCWAEASGTTGFLRTDGKPTKADTQVRLCYDQRNLYFGIICQEPHVDRLLRKVTVENGPVWEDDSIELFIAPDVLYKDSFYHLVFNTLGTRFSAAKGAALKGAANWRVATKVSPGRWSAEVAVPFSMLGVTRSTPVHVMAASVCRERWAGVKEFTHWPVGGSFHRPEGHLLFTSYDRFVREVLLRSWQASIDPLRRSLLAHPAATRQVLPHLSSVAAPIDVAMKRELGSGQLAAADCEHLIRSLKTAEAALPPIRYRVNMLLLERLVNQ